MKEAAPSSRKRSFSKLGRTKSKEAATRSSPSPSNQAYALPSVPSTQHLHRQGRSLAFVRFPRLTLQADVHIASLFAFHRPISVKTPLPTPTTPKAFSAIFSTRPVNRLRTAKVIITLQSALQSVEKAAQQAQGEQQDASSTSRQELHNAVVQAAQNPPDPTHMNAEGQPIYIDLVELAKNFRPFHPPPPPVPMNEHDAASVVQSAHVTPLRRQEQEAPGQEEGKEILEPDLPNYVPQQPFLNRLLVRHLEWAKRRRELWHAISVRRQRKLKMKKHKYKKLMKRTRNLRRRQDRL